MPTSPTIPGWWHTTAAVNMRAAPGGKIRKIQPPGHNMWIVKETTIAGRAWIKTNLGNWYAREFCASGKAPKPSRVASPVPGYPVSYPFGVRSSRYHAGFHTGADHKAPTGTPVVSVRAGKVTRSGWGGAYGNWLHVKADNGYTYVYCHLSSRAVSVGQRVKAGQRIGRVGSSGNVTGPHLHHEMTLRKGSWSYAQVQNPRW